MKKTLIYLYPGSIRYAMPKIIAQKPEKEEKLPKESLVEIQCKEMKKDHP
jgi:hypothetical protein